MMMPANSQRKRQGGFSATASAMLACAVLVLCGGASATARTVPAPTSETAASPSYLPAMDHVGIVVRDADKAAARLQDLFGASVLHRETLHFRKAIYKGKTLAYSAYFVFVQMGNTKIEFIQPDPDAPSPYLDILREKGEYAHHLCFLVPSVPEQLARFRAHDPDIQVVVEAWAGAGPGGQMVYVEGVIPGTLVELATPL